MQIFRGEIYLVELNQTRGSEQGGIRPVLIIQNNVGNKFSPTVIVASITSKLTKTKMPTHVEVKASYDGLVQDSKVMLEQIRTIDKSRIRQKLGEISKENIEKVDQALLVSLSLST